MRKSSVISRTAERNCYESGVQARDMGKDKTTPPGLGAQRRAWWLAGWNDRDIELQVLERNRRKGMTEVFREYAVKVQNEDVETSTVDHDYSIIGIVKMPPMEYDEP